MEYTGLMNQTETNVFFRVLHDLEDIYAKDLHDPDPEYLEGYDYVMDIVKDAIFDGEEVRNARDLDNFINQADSYADDFEGEYSRGYQMAANICLKAVSQLFQSVEVWTMNTIQLDDNELECVRYFLQHARDAGYPSGNEPYYPAIDKIMSKIYEIVYPPQPDIWTIIENDYQDWVIMKPVIFLTFCLLVSTIIQTHVQNVDQIYPRNAVDLNSYGVVRVGASGEVRWGVPDWNEVNGG